MYQELILSGSFTLESGKRIVNSDLVNSVAALWAKNERGIDVIKKGSEQGKDIYPL